MKKRGLWWWVDKWRGSSAYIDMSLAEQGAYRNLLDEIRLRGGALPNDERTLAKACGDPVEWPAVRAKVMAKFVLSADGGSWTNPTATAVNAVSDALSAAQAAKGRTRAAAAGRRGGRFRPAQPAEPPAGGPAEVPAAPPAGHQPSVAVAVSVSGSVAVGNGLAPAVAVAPRALAKPTAKTHPWSQEFTDDYRAAYGGDPYPALFDQAKGGVRKYGWERVRPVLRWYMEQSPAEYVNLAKFFSALPSWEKRMGGAPVRGSPKPSVGERQLAAAAEFIRKGGEG